MLCPCSLLVDTEELGFNSSAEPNSSECAVRIFVRRSLPGDANLYMASNDLSLFIKLGR